MQAIACFSSFYQGLVQKRPIKSAILVGSKFTFHFLQVRQEISAEIARQRVEGRSLRQPETTIRHGQLRSDRFSRPQSICMNDLAALDVLNEVSTHFTTELEYH